MIHLLHLKELLPVVTHQLLNYFRCYYVTLAKMLMTMLTFWDTPKILRPYSPALVEHVYKQIIKAPSNLSRCNCG